VLLILTLPTDRGRRAADAGAEEDRAAEERTRKEGTGFAETDHSCRQQHRGTAAGTQDDQEGSRL